MRLTTALLSTIGMGAALGSIACSSPPDSGTATTSESSLTSTVDAVFEVDCVPTRWGQNVYVVGNVPELGSWDPKKAVPLSGMFGGQFESNFLFSWDGTVKLQTGTAIEFKFILIDENGYVTWESGANRTEKIGGPIEAATSLSTGVHNTIYTYGDYWNRENGGQCTSHYNDWSNYLGQQRA